MSVIGRFGQLKETVSKVGLQFRYGPVEPHIWFTNYMLYLVNVPVILAVWYTFGTPLTNGQMWKSISWCCIEIAIFTALLYQFIEKPCLGLIAKYKAAQEPVGYS